MAPRPGNRSTACRRRTLFALSFSLLVWWVGSAMASPARRDTNRYRVNSDLLRAKLSPYRALPNPFTAKSSPYGALPNPFTAKFNPYGACPNPFTAKPNPYGAWPNPFTAKPNPYGAWPNPFNLQIEMPVGSSSAVFEPARSPLHCHLRTDI